MIDGEVLAYLQQQPWPGNVRELKNVVRKAALFCDRHELTLEAVARAMGQSSLAAAAVEHGRPVIRPAVLSIPEAEKHAIRQAFIHTAGNKTRAAEVLQLSLKTLLTKIRKYSL